MTISASPPADEVVSCVRLVTELSRRLGQDELAVTLREHAERPVAAVPHVVVVGETKRGKSSLVNALVREPGLSPVLDDVATCVHVAIQHGATRAARIAVREQDPAEIAVESLGDWVTEDANPGNGKGVRFAEVELPLDLLRMVTVVDTPGVGGLVLGHAELTLQALRGADAVVFVVDATAPLTAPEKDFLRRVAGRVDTLVIALTKIDRGDWQTIRAEDETLLAAMGERFAELPIIGVSSVRAQRAERRPTPELVEQQRAAAGLTELERYLIEVVAGRAAALGAANTLRFCLQALDDLQELCRQRVATVAAGPQRQAELAAEQTRLAAMAPRESRWRRQSDAKLSDVHEWRAADLHERLRVIQDEYIGLARQAGSVRRDAATAALQRLAGQACAATTAATRAVAEETRQRLAEAIDSIVDELSAAAPLRDQIERIAATGPAPTAGYERSGAATLSGAKVMRLLSPGLTVMRLSTMLGPASPLAIPAGLAAAVYMGMESRVAEEREAFIGWLRQTAADVEAQQGRAYRTAVAELRVELGDALDEAIRKAKTEVTRQQLALAEARKASDADRAAQVARIMKEQSAVEALAFRVGSVLGELLAETVPGS